MHDAPVLTMIPGRKPTTPSISLIFFALQSCLQTLPKQQKYSQVKEDLKETTEKLIEEEEEVTTLKKELKSLQEDFDEKKVQHDREMNRSKIASDKVSLEFLFSY